MPSRDREIAYGRRTRIEHHDLDAWHAQPIGGLVSAGTPEQAAPSASIATCRATAAAKLTQVSRGIAQPLGRQGERVAHRLPGDRYRGVTRRPSLVRDGGTPKASDTASDGDHGP